MQKPNIGRKTNNEKGKFLIKKKSADRGSIDLFVERMGFSCTVFRNVPNYHFPLLQGVYWLIEF